MLIFLLQKLLSIPTKNFIAQLVEHSTKVVENIIIKRIRKHFEMLQVVTEKVAIRCQESILHFKY